MLGRKHRKGIKNDPASDELTAAVDSLLRQTEALSLLLELPVKPLETDGAQTPAMQLGAIERRIALAASQISLRGGGRPEASSAGAERRQLEEALEQANASCQGYREQTRQLTRQLAALREEQARCHCEAERRLLASEDRLQAERERTAQAQASAQKQLEGWMGLCKGLIRFRDQLRAQLEYAKEGPAAQAIAGTLALSRNILEDNGIQVLDTEGRFDVKHHCISGTVPTDDPARDQHIQSTVKEGYAVHGKLIRPQEVVLFRYTPQEAPPAGGREE